MQGSWPNFLAIAGELSAGAQPLAEEVTELIRPYAPVGKSYGDDGVEHGKLRDSLTGRGEGGADGLHLEVVSGEDSARYVLEGTAPHEIRPVNAKRLRFWVEGGDIVFAQVVHHPGTTANPFPEQAQGAIDALLQQRVGELVTRALTS